VKTYSANGDPTVQNSGTFSSYVANVDAFNGYYGWTWGGPVASRYLPTRFPASYTDGTSNTLFYTEAYQQYHDWTSTNSSFLGWGWGANFQVAPPTSSVNGSIPNGFSVAGVQVALGDGSVRSVGLGVSNQSWQAALSPSGGDTFDSSW